MVLVLAASYIKQGKYNNPNDQVYGIKAGFIGDQHTLSNTLHDSTGIYRNNKLQVSSLTSMSCNSRASSSFFIHESIKILLPATCK